MKLFEIFGMFNKQRTTEQLIKKIGKQLRNIKRYLHLAHTKQRFMDNKHYFAMEVETFHDLLDKHNDGELVDDQLQELSNRLSEFEKDPF